MKKVLIAIVLLAGVGYFAFVLNTRQVLAHHGISDEQPLGDFEKLDRILTEEKHLRRSKLSKFRDPDIRPSAKMYKYEDSGNKYQYVILLLDRQDNLLGIAGWYMSPAFGASRSPARFFMEGHWRRCGGARRPGFTQFKLGAITYQQTKFTEGRVIGNWKRSRNESRGQDPTYEHIYLRAE